MITGQEKPDKGTIKIGESVHLGYVDPPRDSLDGKNGWGGNLRQPGLDPPGQEGNSGPNARRSISRAPTGRRRSARCRAARATACIWPRCCVQAPTCCCSTSRPATSTIDTLRAGKALEDFAGCAVIVATAAGSSTASPRTFWRSWATTTEWRRGQLPGTRTRCAARSGQHHSAPVLKCLG